MLFVSAASIAALRIVDGGAEHCLVPHLKYFFSYERSNNLGTVLGVGAGLKKELTKEKIKDRLKRARDRTVDTPAFTFLRHHIKGSRQRLLRRMGQIVHTH